MMDVREKLVELICRFCSGLAVSDITPPYGYENLADFMISNGATVQEWISVDDRLPDDNDRVIAFRPNEPETSGYKYCVMWGWSVKASLKHRGITHWMDMPQPPKGE